MKFAQGNKISHTDTQVNETLEMQNKNEKETEIETETETNWNWNSLNTDVQRWTFKVILTGY